VCGLGGTVLALNGDSTHIHLVVSLPTTITVADLVKRVKGVSSHFANKTLRPQSQFRWQGGYAAFTVSRWDLLRVIGYVKRQKEHHGIDDVWEELEETHELVETPA
jgi:REP element-mobilizing transposase RayT